MPYPSGGASPVLTQIIKERIRQVIPEHTGEIAEQLGSLRPEILSLFPESSQKRKKFLRNGHSCCRAGPAFNKRTDR